ncbi:MAG: hypothetical protein V4671_16305 [Armatimonadota bacterium]
MRTLTRLGTLLLWIGLGVLGAVLYGIVNDQITVTLSPEYFSVFKRRQFAPILEQAGLINAPVRVQAVLVGTVATWWFGLLLGIVLSISGTAGRRPALPTRLFIRAVGGIMLFTLALSVFCGAVGYFAEPFIKPEPANWPFLTGIQEVRRAFAVGFWHNGAYLGGLVGTVGAILWGKRQRSTLV